MFNRRIWRNKPPIGTPLISGHIAPDLIALPLNEIGVELFRNYAIKTTDSSLATFSANGTVTTVQGRYGPSVNTPGSGLDGLVTTFSIDSLPTSECTIILGIRKKDTTLRTNIIGNSSNNATRINIHLPWNDSNVYWDWGGSSGANRLTTAITVDTNYNIFCVTVGALRGMELFRNGVLLNSAAQFPTRTTGLTSFQLGYQSGLTNSDNVDIDFLYCWSKQLPISFIQQISNLPFSVFEDYRTRIWAKTPGGPTALNETVSDTISLSDSVLTILLDVIEETISDSLSIDDSITTRLDTSLIEELSDTLTLTDSIVSSIDLAAVLNDTITLSDSFVKDVQGGLTLNDTLTNLLDSISIQSGTGLSLVDRLVIVDRIAVALSSTNANNDTYELTDNIQITIALNIILSDALTLSDSITQIVGLLIQIVVGSSLGLSDSTSTNATTSMNNYLRDYLNDVIGVRTPESITPPDSESPNTLNDYLRRYLNDVS